MTTKSLPNITASARFYTRQATVVAARTNFSIMSVDDLTTPTQITDLDIPSYRAALGWLLNYTAANIPPPSSIAQTFWVGRDQYEDPNTYGALLQNFQSVLAFPFWLFNANNYGNIDLQEQIMINTLPPQFYTKASTVMPFVKLKFDTSMFAVFAILQGLAMVFVWAVLVWIWCSGRRLPNTSSYPVFDVTFRTKVFGPETKTEDMLSAGSSDVIRMMKHARVYGIDKPEMPETDSLCDVDTP